MQLGQPLLDTLERMGYGGLLLGSTGEVIQTNDAAVQLLKQHGNVPCRKDGPEWSRQALNGLIRSKGTARIRLDEDAWAVIQSDNAEPSRPVILRVVLFSDGKASSPHSVVILIDLAVTPRPSAAALQKIFDLTPAEARLAIEMACGKSPEEIAVAANVAVGTVRKQLASVFVKTNTHRQVELVALLARLAILP